MGPRNAAAQFRKKHPAVSRFRVTLFGSLAATGIGHLTDKAILEEFQDCATEIVWKADEFLERHPNALKFEALDNEQIIDSRIVYSIGGGTIIDDQQTELNRPISIYPLTTMDTILQWTEENGLQLWEFVEHYENQQIWDYLKEVWQVMTEAVERGIDEEGILPGMLKLPRKAHQYYMKAQSLKHSIKSRSLVFAYALAVAEENAAGGKIVTAPTCGSCGVLPAVLYHMQQVYRFSEKKILKALAAAGLIGNLAKFNASISGAEVGCQGEIGVACAMAAGAVLQLFGGSPRQIEYAAEMGLEHHLGLTCDPIGGLVQVPCIERNAFAAARALDANTYAMLSDGKHRVSFDKVLRTMKATGHDLSNLYKETSTGGLAKD